jgi:hypothetical protein
MTRTPSPALSISAAQCSAVDLEDRGISTHGVGAAYTNYELEQPYIFRGLGRRTHLPALCKETRNMCDLALFEKRQVGLGKWREMGDEGMVVRCIYVVATQRWRKSTSIFITQQLEHTVSLSQLMGHWAAEVLDLIMFALDRAWDAW